MMNKLLTLLAVTALLALASCGESEPTQSQTPDPEPESETVECSGHTLQKAIVGVEVDASPYTVSLTQAAPEYAVRGDNQWLLSVQGPGTPEVTVRPRMPQHDHGTVPDIFLAEAVEDGVYEAGPFNLFMPGYWEINLILEDESGTSTAMIPVCIAP
jgi:hypothetical protein